MTILMAWTAGASPGACARVAQFGLTPDQEHGKKDRIVVRRIGDVESDVTVADVKEGPQVVELIVLSRIVRERQKWIGHGVTHATDGDQEFPAYTSGTDRGRPRLDTKPWLQTAVGADGRLAVGPLIAVVVVKAERARAEAQRNRRRSGDSRR